MAMNCRMMGAAQNVKLRKATPEYLTSCQHLPQLALKYEAMESDSHQLGVMMETHKMETGEAIHALSKQAIRASEVLLHLLTFVELYEEMVLALTMMQIFEMMEIQYRVMGEALIAK